MLIKRDCVFPVIGAKYDMIKDLSTTVHDMICIGKRLWFYVIINHFSVFDRDDSFCFVHDSYIVRGKDKGDVLFFV